MADVADGAASAAGPAVDAGTTAAAGSYESAVKAAGMDAVHTELAFSVWEPQTTIPPKRGRQGAKFYAPTNTEEDIQKLDAARSEWAALAAESRVISVRGLSVGDWNRKAGDVEMSVMRGSHFKSVGRHCRERKLTVLAPEEALFLMDRGVLEVRDGGVPMSLQQAYARLLPASGMRTAELVTYLFLRRMGYTVLRTAPRDDASSSQLDAVKGDRVNADGDASAPNGSTDGSSSDADGNGGVGGWAATVAMFLKRFSLGVISAMGPALAALREAWASSPEEVAALLRETDRQSLETVHERLRELVTRNAAVKPPSTPSHERRLRVTLDVHKLNSAFKKSDPGPPDYRLCVCDFTDEAPTRAEFLRLTEDAAPAVLKFAVVDGGSVAFYGMLDLDFPVYADWGAPNTGGGGGGGRGGDGGRGGGRGGRGRGRGGGGGGGRGDRQRGGDGARERDANGTSKRKREDGDDASERPHKSIPSETPDASMRDEGAVNSGAVGDAGTRRVRWGDDSVPNSPAGSNATAPPVMERLSEH